MSVAWPLSIRRVCRGIVIAFIVLGASRLAFGQNASAPVPAPAPVLHALTPRVNDRSVRLWLTIFPTAHFTLRVIDNAAANGRPRYFDLAAAMKAEGCIAGVNGGFFDRDPFNPVGLMISDGRRAGVFQGQGWLRGLLVLRADGPALEESAGFDPAQPGLLGLLQSGPWLVRAGQAETDNSRAPTDKRTFIGHDGKGRWFLGYCDACSLHELAGLLRGSEVAAVIDVKSALNLDGGPSSGFWIGAGAQKFHRQEYWSVRNFIGATPKVSGSAPAAAP